MSAVASEAEAVVDSPPEQQPGPMIESDDDRFETQLEYGKDAKLPIPVVLVWLCAVIGLGAYMVNLYVPELALWMK